MPPPPAPNVLEDIRGFVLSIPTITRYLTFGTLAFSLGLQFGLCKIQQIVLLADPLKKLEIWRLVSAHLISGGQGMILHLFLLYQNSRALEEGTYSGKRGEFAFIIFQIMALLDITGLYMNLPVLTSAFGMALIYISSQIRGDQITSFMFGFQFKSKFLPWVYILWDIVMGGNIMMSLIGIVTGHAVYYANILFPLNNNGRTLISTPAFFNRMFPAPTGIHGFNQGQPQTKPPGVRPMTGRGYKLGSS